MCICNASELDELIANEYEDFIFQHNRDPPHWKLTVLGYLNENLPGR